MIETKKWTIPDFNPGIIYLKGKILFLKPHLLVICPFLDIPKAKLIPSTIKVLGDKIVGTENFACDTWYEETILVFVVMTQGVTRHDQRKEYHVTIHRQQQQGLLRKVALHAKGNNCWQVKNLVAHPLETQLLTSCGQLGSFLWLVWAWCNVPGSRNKANSVLLRRKICYAPVLKTLRRGL